MKLRRRVCLIFAVIFTALLPLAVSSFAYDNDYNLVEKDVALWNAIPFDGETARIVARGNDLVQFYFSSTPSGNLNVGGAYYQTIPSGFLVAGRSYVATFSVPSGSQLKSFFGSATESAAIDSYISICFPSNSNRTLVFGVGTMDLSTNDYTPFASTLEEQCIINKDNIRSLIGKTISYSFVCPDYTGGTVVVNFGILQTVMPAISQTSWSIIMGRYVSLFDYEQKTEMEQYNRIWFGNAEGDYSNPFPTENYNIGDAGDLTRIDNAVSQWEQGLGELGTPVRVCGVFLNSLFSTGGIALIGVIVLVILMFGIILRILGVT